MRTTHLTTVLLLALAAPDARSTTAGGTVTGIVVAIDSGKPTRRDEMFVYLETAHDRRKHAAATTPREIRQQNRQFVPHAMVVPVGTTVAFPNYDREEHNVFSPTDPPGLPDLGRYNTDHKGKTWTLDDAYEIAIFCDIHKEMSAYVKAVDTDPSLIAKVGADGRFTLAGVPPGTYTVHAWTYASKESTETVTVADGASAAVPELHVQLGKIKAHLRKDGTPYPPYQK